MTNGLFGFTVVTKLEHQDQQINHSNLPGQLMLGNGNEKMFELESLLTDACTRITFRSQARHCGLPGDLTDP